MSPYLRRSLQLGGDGLKDLLLVYPVGLPLVGCTGVEQGHQTEAEVEESSRHGDITAS